MKKINITIGQKVAVLNAGDLVPTLYKGVVRGFYYSKYAQYENALYIYIQRPRAKRIDRLVLLETNIFFIFDGYNFKETWRKEIMKDTKEVTHSLLHKWTYEDLKDNKDLIYSHRYGEKFNVNDNFERFADVTCDYMMQNNIRHYEATTNENYINYIKEVIQNYNIDSLIKYTKSEGYVVLENCLKLATNYDW
ncbi:MULTISPECIES: hypothetical protein [unclassified Clostridium]|uniref:hypothetical protein n=1 Tax=unclassified Clostridium TaxID=2614128 RepID=UPI0025C4480D|nr:MULTISPECIES: hypothetical protein [unclassified Clostridium]